MSNKRLEDLLVNKSPVELKAILLGLPPEVQELITDASAIQKDKVYGITPRYPDRSPQFSDLIAKVKSFMGKYERVLTMGGVLPRDELLIDGYKWENRAVEINLRKAEGHHGGDFIGVSEQTLTDSSDKSKPQSLGVMTYEGGNGKLYAYATFSLDGNNRYQKTTDLYVYPTKEPIENMTEPIANGTSNGNPEITVEQFLESIYSLRDTLSLAEIRPNVKRTQHLWNNKRKA